MYPLILNQISIHPMLRFIAVPGKLIPIREKYFNTSHVTVYLWYSFWGYIRRFISIHPMLRFIIIFCWLSTATTAFQYIPCYGLSITNAIKLTRQLNFNTSHVTVYPISLFSYYGQFDNFNTSHVTVYLVDECQIMFNARFQYIPCYGLSTYALFNTPVENISIHPMLRFIFHPVRNQYYYR